MLNWLTKLLRCLPKAVALLFEPNVVSWTICWWLTRLLLNFYSEVFFYNRKLTLLSTFKLNEMTIILSMYFTVAEKPNAFVDCLLFPIMHGSAICMIKDNNLKRILTSKFWKKLSLKNNNLNSLFSVGG